MRSRRNCHLGLVRRRQEHDELPHREVGDMPRRSRPREQSALDRTSYLLLVSNNQIGNTHMLTKMKLALAAVLVLGTASTALAGGYVVPGSMDGVNPAYHPRWFPEYGRVMRAYDRANAVTYSSAGAAYGFVPPVTHHKHPR
jgi:hypothetical protein